MAEVRTDKMQAPEILTWNASPEGDLDFILEFPPKSWVTETSMHFSWWKRHTSDHE